MTETNFEVIVVGGGISGLGAAHYALRSGRHTLVLEKSARPGGCINTQAYTLADGPFWTEMGAHTCFNSYGHLLDILEDLGQLGRLIPKERLSYQLLINGQLKSVFSELSLLQLAFSLPRLFFCSKDKLTVAEYYSRIAGSANYGKVLSAAFDAVICQPAGEFPASSLFRRKPRRKDIARSFTTAEGLSGVIEAIANQPKLHLRLGSPVATVVARPKGYQVILSDGETLSCSQLVLAVPPDAAAAMLVTALPGLAAKLRKIQVVEVDSLAFATASETIKALAPMAGIIARENDFYSMVSRDPVADPHFRGFTFHFRPGRVDPAAQLARAASVLGIPGEKVLDHRSARNKLPALRRGHARLMEEIDQELRNCQLGLTGNYFLGVSIEDCLTRSYSECARLGFH